MVNDVNDESAFLIVKENNKDLKVSTLYCITCVTLCGSNHCTQALYLHSEKISPSVVALSIGSNMFVLLVIRVHVYLYSLSGCDIKQPMAFSVPDLTTDEMYYDIEDQTCAVHETIKL